MPKDFNSLDELSVLAPKTLGGFDLSMKAPMTAAELMATPDHMLAWLRTKNPSEIVTESIHDPDRCLGCSFMAAHGHPEVTFGGSGFGPNHMQSWPMPAWFAFTTSGVVGRLLCSGYAYNTTAAQAIAAIEAARRTYLAERV